MSDDYTAFSEKIVEVAASIKEAMRIGVKLPPPVANDLCHAASHYMKADKELSRDNEEEASKELKEALRYACRASFDMLKFRFLFYSKFASSVIAELEEHKDLAPRCITNYDEQSTNFPEIISLIKETESPREDSPGSRATCEDVIKKLQAFLSNFRTGKGELFPTQAADPKTDIWGKSNSYNELNYNGLKREFFRKFEEAEVEAKVAEQVAEKFLTSVASGLYNGVASYKRADRKLFKGDERGAVTELKEATYCSHRAFFYALKLHLLGLLQKACDICTQKIKGYETVVLACEPKYEKHFKNLSDIRGIIENKEFPDEASVESQDAYSKEIEKLHDFLEDFEADKGNLAKAIRDERKAQNEAQETRKKNQESSDKGFWRSLGEKALTVAVTVTVSLLVFFVVVYALTYFFGEYLNQNPIFWKLITFLKP